MVNRDKNISDHDLKVTGLQDIEVYRFFFSLSAFPPSKPRSWGIVCGRNWIGPRIIPTWRTSQYLRVWARSVLGYFNPRFHREVAIEQSQEILGAWYGMGRSGRDWSGAEEQSGAELGGGGRVEWRREEQSEVRWGGLWVFLSLHE